MGCNMYEGATSGDFAMSKAQDNEREVYSLRSRVAELEEALCGLCQMIEDGQRHPQLQSWFDRHKRKPGCDLYGK